MADNEQPLNWNELANVAVGSVEPPKLIPPGHYQAVITGEGKVDNVGKKKTLLIEFPCRLIEPLSDVDMEAFEASDGFRRDGYSLGFYLTPASLYRFTEFGKGMGADESMSVPELAEWLATSGEPFAVQVNHGTGKSGNTFIQLDNPIPLSEFQG